MEIGLSQGFFGFIYFDPTDEELIQVAKSSFDTLRMGIHKEKDKEYLVFANGYGCTHSSISRAMGMLNPRLKPNHNGEKYQGINGGCLILYEENNRPRLLFNAGDWSMSEESKPEEVLRYIKESAYSQLKELVRLIKEQRNL